MANAIDRTPIVLDTVANNIYTTTTSWAKVRWVGATTAGHAATITNAAGHVVWTSVAAGANNVEIDTFVTPRPLIAQGGLNVTVLNSGILYLYPW